MKTVYCIGFEDQGRFVADWYEYEDVRDKDKLSTGQKKRSTLRLLCRPKAPVSRSPLWRMTCLGSSSPTRARKIKALKWSWHEEGAEGGGDRRIRCEVLG